MIDVDKKDYLLGAAAYLLDAVAWRLGMDGNHALKEQAQGLAEKITKELGME